MSANAAAIAMITHWAGHIQNMYHSLEKEMRYIIERLNWWS